MRILMLSWEYPPRVVGGLSQHVYFLSQSLANLGHEIHVVTCSASASAGAGVEAEADANADANSDLNANNAHHQGFVQVHRVKTLEIENNDFAKWTMLLNFSMLEQCAKLINAGMKFDVVHGHDWLVAFCANSLKEIYGLPLVMTIHATEAGRNHGISTDLQRFIHSAESHIVQICDQLIVCSNFMQAQVCELFGVEKGKITIIPNGVEKSAFSVATADLSAFRKQYAADHEKIVFYIGRLVFEKGVQLLVKAAPLVLEKNSSTRFIIAGAGPMDGELRQMVKALGLDGKFLFADYIDEDSKDKLYGIADVAVFPSLYEPFGIVALEAMNAGCPVVAADVGGFSELLENEVSGLKTTPGSYQSIADALNKLLLDKELRARLSTYAKKQLEDSYSWDHVAEQTQLVLQKTCISK